MKNNLFLIFLFLYTVQCNSQKTKNSFKETNYFENISQLNGKWYNVLKKIQKNGVSIKINMQCTGKSFWHISTVNGNSYLLKNYATGKNCNIHTIKTSGLDFKNGNLDYIEEDVRKSEKLEILSDTEFKIVEKTFSNGTLILIENFYEKK